MKETTLVILAAGIGSRFGGGIKQLAPVGPSGEIIMDYSIYDALKAGFNKIVFIIRKDIEEDFRRITGIASLKSQTYLMPFRICPLCPMVFPFRTAAPNHGAPARLFCAARA